MLDFAIQHLITCPQKGAGAWQVVGIGILQAEQAIFQLFAHAGLAHICHAADFRVVESAQIIQALAAGYGACQFVLWRAQVELIAHILGLLGESTAFKRQAFAAGAAQLGITLAREFPQGLR